MMKAQSHGLSILSFDGARLAFSLTEAVGIERASTVIEESSIPLAVGSVGHAGKRWPVFAFDSRLRLLPRRLMPASRMYYVCLSADGSQSGIALASDTVNPLTLSQPVDAATQPLPDCAQLPDSPLTRWYLNGDELLWVSSAPALAQYIRGRAEQSAKHG